MFQLELRLRMVPVLVSDESDSPDQFPPTLIQPTAQNEGCTVVTALLSLALNRPVAQDLAMTGEVTLTGRVLPIGGVKEKVLAARRSGVKVLIFPEANKKDYDELSKELKEGLSPHFVSTFAEVYKLALGHDPT